MQDRKTRFIEFMLGAGVLSFGDFTTKSGRKTPFFINTGHYVKGSQMDALGAFYAEALLDAFSDGFDNLYGPAYKGIPLCVAASMALSRLKGRDITYTFNRKEAKDHGEGGFLVGYPYAKAEGTVRVVIVEDVITAGTSVRESLPLLRRHPAVEVAGLLVSVDRMEKGRGSLSALEEVREEFGLKTASLVDMTDLIAYLESPAGAARGFGPDLLARMREYRARYGAQG